jgi:hypothetical protein
MNLSTVQTLGGCGAWELVCGAAAEKIAVHVNLFSEKYWFV